MPNNQLTPSLSISLSISLSLEMDFSPKALTPYPIIPPPPPFPAPPRSVDLSALEFILGLIAIISIPALIYTFFFTVKCPPDSFRRRGQSSAASSSDTPPDIPDSSSSSAAAATSEVKYSKEAHEKELGGECPVCLSAFAEGEDVKRMSSCDHAFHAACIDPWLSSHANCPVCRASVAVNVNDDSKRPSSGGGSGSGSLRGSGGNNSNNRGLSRTRDDDLRQGLPDAANLV